MKISGNKLISENGKELMRKADGAFFGNELTLAYTYYIGGIKLDTPHLELPSDYIDVYIINVEDTDYPVESYEYGYLKAYIIKLKYSNDDQIAIILKNIMICRIGEI